MYIHRYPQININQQVYHDFPHTVMWLKQFHEPSPSHHNFYRWYKLKGYHSQSWVVYGIVFPISLTMLGPSSTVPCTAHQCRSASAILHGLKGFERPRNVMPIFWSPPKWWCIGRSSLLLTLFLFLFFIVIIIIIIIIVIIIIFIIMFIIISIIIIIIIIIVIYIIRMWFIGRQYMGKYHRPIYGDGG